ncbi:RICIN domain-containing protein [Streptomyces sp. KMM 9044]|uniref:RICIN domain-containing protein n=1 Tax=Streptomyces sp. KMM 9044 TaxID=2744474 RepID=UPI002151D007|nr:RICIN domain-containing protein [Streptomyces sp. KMM 9044]WAX79400.1 RICIN domain-containing protein [Streptomyces sp. KMM 9044]
MAALAGTLMALASPAIADTQPSNNREMKPVALRDVRAASADGKSLAAAQYGIANKKSGKFLQPLGGSSANGTKVVQQPFNSSSLTQVWERHEFGDFLTFENYNGLNLGIDRASTANGAAAIIANPAGDQNQDWKQVARDEYTFELRNRKSGKCLGIDRASTANGAQAAQFTCDSGDANQGWGYFQ